MIPVYDNLGNLSWSIYPSLQNLRLRVNEGSITNCDGTYWLPAIDIELSSDVTSVSIERKGDTAYYVIWTDNKEEVLDGEFIQLLCLIWKVGDVWYYAADESSGANH